ncbi:MAG: peptide-methionine (S)-S-oxide reductase [Alphaproteobacteria bacterium]
MQPVFDNTPGVLRTEVGYTGGHVADPTYEQVSSGTTGHVEAIAVTYDPAKVKYERCSRPTGRISTPPTARASSSTRARSI